MACRHVLFLRVFLLTLFILTNPSFVLCHCMFDIIHFFAVQMKQLGFDPTQKPIIGTENGIKVTGLAPWHVGTMFYFCVYLCCSFHLSNPPFIFVITSLISSIASLLFHLLHVVSPTLIRYFGKCLSHLENLTRAFFR